MGSLKSFATNSDVIYVAYSKDGKAKKDTLQKTSNKLLTDPLFEAYAQRFLQFTKLGMETNPFPHRPHHFGVNFDLLRSSQNWQTAATIEV